MAYPIPHSSLTAWNMLRQNLTNVKTNAGLVFNRYVNQAKIEEINGIYRAEANITKEAKEKQKLQQVDFFDSVITSAAHSDQECLAAINSRWQAMTTFMNAEPFVMSTAWRLIAGLGSGGPLEVGFTFDRNGFPILPGSSLKGLTRAMGRINIFELLQVEDLKLNDLDDLLQKPDIDPDDSRKRPFDEGWSAITSTGNDKAHKYARAFRTIFGTQEKAGHALFFDGIPDAEHLPVLQLDIMNPHYGKYYSDKNNREYPTDHDSPIPVNFLTVAPNTKFWFAVGWDNREVISVANYEKMLSLAKFWLKHGLTELGAGSKTSAGYGIFAVN
jgi:CRISPR-associated protein Cmr6